MSGIQFLIISSVGGQAAFERHPLSLLGATIWCNPERKPGPQVPDVN